MANLTEATRRRLVAAALKARRRAVAPYSRFHVGAALLTSGGRIVIGANVESASYGLTCCAERVAIFKALTEGMTGFKAIAVASRGGVTPCGACRQVLAEYAPDAVVCVVDHKRPRVVRTFTMAELLPGAFRLVPGARKAKGN
jgi:cytidine deaminase